MKNNDFKVRLILAVLFICFVLSMDVMASQTIVDGQGRKVTVPLNIERIICSGPGCLRLVTYLQAQDLVVAVDDIEGRRRKFDARPYSIATPRYKKLPVFGGFRGHDDPEKILGLAQFPQVIFKTYATMGYDPVELQEKTGIPVVVLNYGDLCKGRPHFFKSLELIGQVLDRKERAKELINYFQKEIAALENRTKDVAHKKSCFVGGIAYKGPHGFQSTEPTYPPFQFLNAENIAAAGVTAGKSIQHSNFSKEKLLTRDPDVLFLDLSTLQLGDKQNGCSELKTDPVFRELTAVKTGKVYGVLPYNWYTQNFGSILADAWYIGKVLYPDRFKDIDPVKKADQIYQSLLPAPAYKEMNALFQNMAFKPVALDE